MATGGTIDLSRSDRDSTSPSNVELQPTIKTCLCLTRSSQPLDSFIEHYLYFLYCEGGG